MADLLVQKSHKKLLTPLLPRPGISSTSITFDLQYDPNLADHYLSSKSDGQ
jgi:hypothetical protein